MGEDSDFYQKLYITKRNVPYFQIYSKYLKKNYLHLLVMCEELVEWIYEERQEYISI